MRRSGRCRSGCASGGSRRFASSCVRIQPPPIAVGGASRPRRPRAERPGHFDHGGLPVRPGSAAASRPGDRAPRPPGSLDRRDRRDRSGCRRRSLPTNRPGLNLQRIRAMTSNDHVGAGSLGAPPEVPRGLDDGALADLVMHLVEGGGRCMLRLGDETRVSEMGGAPLHHGRAVALDEAAPGFLVAIGGLGEERFVGLERWPPRHASRPYPPSTDVCRRAGCRTE